MQRKRCEKNFLKVFSENLVKTTFQIGIWYERDKNRFGRAWKEVNSLEFSSSQKESARYKFESFCKKIIREYYWDMLKSIIRRSKHEIGFEKLSTKEMDSLFVIDEYAVDKYHFDVHGFDVAIEGDALYEALSNLPPRYRDVFLLAYFIGLKDRETAQLLNQALSTVQSRRTSSKAKLKKMLGGSNVEQKQE